MGIGGTRRRGSSRQRGSLKFTLVCLISGAPAIILVKALETGLLRVLRDDRAITGAVLPRLPRWCVLDGALGVVRSITNLVTGLNYLAGNRFIPTRGWPARAAIPKA